MKIITLFLLIMQLVLFNLPVRLYAANDKNISVKFLCEYGRSLYQEGDIEGAKQEFKKVLLIDPNNKIALNFLKKMGENAPGEAKLYSLSQEYLASFKDDMDFMIGKIALLENKNKELSLVNKKLSEDNRSLQDKFNRNAVSPKQNPAKPQDYSKRSDTQYQLNLMENNLRKKEIEVKDLKLQVAKLSEESGNIKKNDPQIENLESGPAKPKNLTVQQQASLEQARKDFNEKAIRYEVRIKDLQDRLEQLKKDSVLKINEHQAKIYEDKLKTAGDAFLVKNQELSKKNMELLKINAELSKQDTLIILEKDQIIKDLRSQNDDLRVSKSNDIKLLNDKLLQASSAQNSKEVFLNNNLLNAKNKLKESAEKITQLQKQLSEKTEESKKLNSEYAGLKDSQALLEQAKKDFS
ncbi:MAG: hypothetical protein ABH882_07400, partial [Candidatus Omnitrophota bacterium]|nr:hypothetical protein [Candidatus Omnitrophota bacterium]MBU1928780.1 hypothetical protein [Candidatus Omnitrophota bacterium]MBU2034235.1 hypothetical protein [Candidatus Omnitrophota bacterium]MBU2257752.1 hypothetical protein [Candidatus Omnitrophota bacterium]